MAEKLTPEEMVNHKQIVEVEVTMPFIPMGALKEFKVDIYDVIIHGQVQSGINSHPVKYSGKIVGAKLSDE